MLLGCRSSSIRLKEWMGKNLIEWMLLTYARDARGRKCTHIPYRINAYGLAADDAKAKMSGVASRFEFHLNRVWPLSS